VFKDDRKVKTEKEVLDLGCVTPDCRGVVNVVVVGKENGEKVGGIFGITNLFRIQSVVSCY
jgi:hypothetical protein